jgi:hypothetical protein
MIERRDVMKIATCASLMLAVLCNTASAQGTEQVALARQNLTLDKTQAALLKDFGGRVVSITRDFRTASLVVEVADVAELDAQAGLLPSASLAGEPVRIPRDTTPRQYDYRPQLPRPDFMRDTTPPPPPSDRATIRSFVDKAMNMPIHIETRPGGGWSVTYKGKF